MKRILDIMLSVTGLILMSPILIPVVILIYLQDFHSPFYIAPRVTSGGKLFRMIKLRSMLINADNNGVDSTSVDDPRITFIGRIIRKFKLDEVSQLWNVLLGQMSLVGPRPNVKRETDLYTELEMRLLSVKPGMTDISSIIFSDEGDILAGSKDPDLTYNQLIRPWKSMYGLFYIDHWSLKLDIYLIGITCLSVLSRTFALKLVRKLLIHLGADDKLIEVAQRNAPLQPTPPPGSLTVVYQRDLSLHATHLTQQSI